jgi:hypothetical protein
MKRTLGYCVLFALTPATFEAHVQSTSFRREALVPDGVAESGSKPPAGVMYGNRGS